MSSVITGLCAWMTGKGVQIGFVKLEEDVNVLLDDVDELEDIDVLLEDADVLLEDVIVGVRRGRGASFRGFEAI